MAEKELIAKLGVDADLQTLEKYRDLMDSVLGTYNENIEQLVKLKQENKEYEATLKKIEDEIKKGNITREQANALIVENTGKISKNKTAISQLNQTIKEQEKLMRADNEEYKRTNSVVNLLSQTYRKMSKEQRTANKDLATDINALRQNLKDADSLIGNFQRNVGNYPKLLQQIIPIQNNFTNGLLNSAQQAGLTGGALGSLGVILGGVATGYKIFRNSMELTQTIGDAVAVSVAGWTGVWEEFVRMVATADFSNFIQNLVNARNIGEEVAEILDELFERNNALSIAEAEASVAQQNRLKTMRDQTKSIKERVEAADEYIAKEKELGKIAEDIAKQEYDARLKEFINSTKLSEEETLDFIRNYDKKRNVIAEYNKKIKEYDKEIKDTERLRNAADGIQRVEYNAELAELRKKRKEYIDNLDADTKKIIYQYDAYNKANDKLTDDLVKAWVKRDTAEANALQRTQRAEAIRNSLVAQTQKKEISATDQTVKAKQDESDKIREIQDRLYLESLSDRDRELELLRRKFEQERALLEAAGESTVELAENYAQKRLDVIAKYSKIDTKSIKAEIDAELAEIDESINKAVESGELAPVATSAFARWLGVTDEEFKQIKSQALQFAQQLYSQLEQMAKDSIQRRLDDELDALDRETESKKAALKKRADDGVISQKSYERRLAEIDKEAAARQEELKKEAFEKEKRLNIIEATINGAQAVAKTLAKYGWTPAGQIMAAIALAQTAAQTAIIASQKYARGGLLQGASHAQGGIKGTVQGNNIELEGGEVVINKRSAAMFRRELSAINSYNGWGQKFAAGGELPKRFKFAEGGQLPSFAPAPLPSGANTNIAPIINAINKSNDQLERAIYAIERQVLNIRAHVVYDDIESTGNDIRLSVKRTNL